MALITLDPQSITSSFYTVATGNAALVAALASGTSGIIHAQALAASRANDIVLPTPVFIALRGGAIAGARQDVRNLFFTWYIYDTPDRGFWRINGVIPLIESAYPKDSAIPYSYTDVVSIGSETLDSALNLLVRSIQFIVKIRR